MFPERIQNASGWSGNNEMVPLIAKLSNPMESEGNILIDIKDGNRRSRTVKSMKQFKSIRKGV